MHGGGFMITPLHRRPTLPHPTSFTSPRLDLPTGGVCSRTCEGALSGWWRVGRALLLLLVLFLSSLFLFFRTVLGISTAGLFRCIRDSPDAPCEKVHFRSLHRFPAHSDIPIRFELIL